MPLPDVMEDVIKGTAFACGCLMVMTFAAGFAAGGVACGLLYWWGIL